MSAPETLFEHESRMLAAGAFEFILNLDLKRAARSQHFLTLLVVEALREWERMTFTADDEALRELSRGLAEGLRTTDLIGRADGGMLAVLLIDCEFEQAANVVERLVTRIEHHNFSKPLRVIVGAAGFPGHATDAVSLKRQAIGRPIASIRTGSDGPDPSVFTRTN